MCNLFCSCYRENACSNGPPSLPLWNKLCAQNHKALARILEKNTFKLQMAFFYLKLITISPGIVPRCTTTCVTCQLQFTLKLTGSFGVWLDNVEPLCFMREFAVPLVMIQGWHRFIGRDQTRCQSNRSSFPSRGWNYFFSNQTSYIISYM